MNSQRILFVRHAQSRKNIDDITGGAGAALTESGRLQAAAAASDLAFRVKRGALAPNALVVSSPPQQCEETADVIAEALAAKNNVDPALSAAGMGPLAGLSAECLSERFPDSAARLALWRRGQLEACDLGLPEMESPSSFWTRTLEALSRYKNASSLVVVTTRSLMVLAANLRLGRHPRPGGGYLHRDIAYCEVVEVGWDLIAKECETLRNRSSEVFGDV